MPRFYISCEGAQVFEDTEGTELPDLAAARVQAVEQSGEIMRENARAFTEAAWWRVTVRDEARRPVMVLTLDVAHPAPTSTV